MNIWRISGNSNYKSCILIDNNDKQIYDPAFYFKEKQEGILIFVFIQLFR